MLKSVLRISTGRSSFLLHLAKNELKHSQQLQRISRASFCCCYNAFKEQNKRFKQDYSSYTPVIKRSYTSAVTADGFFTRILRSVGFQGKFKYSKTMLRRSALRLYMCAVELVDYDVFFKELELDDTFYSWFKITELHIWMCMVRLSSEDKEGLFLRNNFIKFLWEDTDKRMKKLGGVDMQNRREGIECLSEHLKGSIFSYDEGLISGDKELAGALWRSLYDEKCEDPEKLALMVEYVRKQLHHLDNIPSSQLLRTGIITFLPLSGSEDKQRTKQILLEITQRV